MRLKKLYEKRSESNRFKGNSKEAETLPQLFVSGFLKVKTRVINYETSPPTNDWKVVKEQMK